MIPHESVRCDTNSVFAMRSFEKHRDSLVTWRFDFHGAFCPDPASHDTETAAWEPMIGPNQFPDDKKLPGFATTIEAYMDNMSSVGHAMMKGLALGLKLNDDYFHDKFNPAFPMMALWHYPPVPGDIDSWGVGPYTDYGVLTLLMQDGVGGLQVETRCGDWIDIPPITAIHSIGTFVVNIGDVIEAWTKGKLRATVHRVRNSTRDHRISAPFFFHPGLDCIIESLDDVFGIDRCPEDLGKTAHIVLSLHEPFTFGDYVLNKFQKSYGKEMSVIN
ncbi:putative iron/ascorbate oxidoreductase [Stylophora pistillata]|uniref:Putative iron/ascorbate oxidoreductase n=1 Tax=Stylophora pistillata TaxID=50429 RepID=A0A2B4RWJ5_STYPI|nr:putative iron/ascorbate oxidoreductase [Stylophora pistillata]